MPGDDPACSRRDRLLKSANDRLFKITGQNAGSPAVSTTGDAGPPISQDVHKAPSPIEKSPVSNEAYSDSADSAGELKPAVPEIDPRKANVDDLRAIVTFIHTIMLVVMGVFSFFAFHHSCRQRECLLISKGPLDSEKCEEDMFLAKIYYHLGLLSVEAPFLFLTVKSSRHLGWRVFLRILTGLSLYCVSYVMAAAIYEQLN